MIRSGSDDRGVSIQLTHVMGIAMTTVLIVIVISGASSHLTDERSAAADEQLETIGNRLATEIERVDELGQKGGEATVRATTQERIAGNTYSAAIEDGSACDTGTFTSDDCLVLDVTGLDAERAVPLNLTADVTIEANGSGTFLLTAVDGGSEAGLAVDPVVDRRLRIGVGRSFEVSRFGTVVNPANRPPIAKFDFTPGHPRTGDEVTFTAGESFDPDGEIVAYQWDLDGDGAFDATNETVTEQLDAGPRDVELQVVDDEGGRTNVTKRLRVSGVAYNRDLTETDNLDGELPNAISFSITNEYPQDVDDDVEIEQVLIDPHDDSLERLRNDCDGTDCLDDSDNDEELMVDADGDGVIRDEDAIGITETVPEGGLIVDLDQSIDVNDNETARFWIGDFEDSADLNGETFTIGVRYSVDGHTNSTVFTDVAGSPSVDRYEIITRGEDVYGKVVSDWKLDTLRIDKGGVFSGSEEYHPPDQASDDSDRFVYEPYLGDATNGTVKANLTVARNGSVSAFETRESKSMNRSRILIDTNYVWQSAADWEGGADQLGVVHDSFGGHRADAVQLGYPAEDQWESALRGYWPFDGSTADVSGNGNDGDDEDGPTTDAGVFGKNPGSYDLGGDAYVDGISDLGSVHTGTSSLSLWLQTPENYPERRYPSQEPAITGHEDSVFWGRVDWDGNIGVWVPPSHGSHHGDSIQSDNSINDGEWHHVVMTYHEPREEVQIFVDGQLEDTEDSVDIDYGGFDELGAIEDRDHDPTFGGKLDEVRSYDRVLSESEVESLASTEGTLTTDWKSGSQSLKSANMSLQYNASVPANTDINVTIHADTDGDGTINETSDRVALSDGQDQASVSGLSTAATQFKIEVEFESDTPLKSPILHQIAITEDA